MNDLEIIQNTPIIQLSAEQLRRLPPDDLSAALGRLFEMAFDGDFAMLASNPPGTTYEVLWDGRKGWSLSPICQCGNEPRFVEAYYEWHGDQ